jgi:hypothetical protein
VVRRAGILPTSHSEPRFTPRARFEAFGQRMSCRLLTERRHRFRAGAGAPRLYGQPTPPAKGERCRYPGSVLFIAQAPNGVSSAVGRSAP